MSNIVENLDTHYLESRRSDLQSFKDELDEQRQEMLDQGLSIEQILVVEKSKERLADIANEFGEEEAQELKELDALAEEVEGWDRGVHLIHVDLFVEHAEEVAIETGCISSTRAWPLDHIDWTAAARELEQDYSTVEFRGDTYYYRP